MGIRKPIIILISRLHSNHCEGGVIVTTWQEPLQIRFDLLRHEMRMIGKEEQIVLFDHLPEEWLPAISLFSNDDSIRIEYKNEEENVDNNNNNNNNNKKKKINKESLMKTYMNDLSSSVVTITIQTFQSLVHSLDSNSYHPSTLYILIPSSN